MQKKIQNVTIEKMKAAVFDGPQLRKVMNDEVFIGSKIHRKAPA